MTRYAVLLRAVNVGGRRAVPMARLRQLLTDAGFADVRTLLQSGNVVVESPDGARAVGHTIADELHRDLGFPVDVVIRTAGELRDLIEANPFPEALSTPARLHICFLDRNPPATWIDTVDPARYLPDVFALGERAIYVHYAVGAGVSKLGRLFDAVPAIATARNWNTVLKLADLLDK